MMKKRVWILALIIVFFVVGCGKANVNETPASETTEDKNITTEIATDSQMETDMTEVSELDDKDTEEVLINNEEKDELDTYITSIKEQSDIIKASLENDDLTQMEMNTKSQELYELWDDALNYLWGEVKASLSEDEFSKLLNEQRTWITEKEKSVEEAGKEVEGGSMYPLVVNMKVAQITEERVYELYEILK